MQRKQNKVKRKAAILLITAVLLGCSTVGGVNTIDEIHKDTNLKTVQKIVAPTIMHTLNGEVLWNNGEPDGRTAIGCQYSPSIDLDRYVADDFIITEGLWRIDQALIHIVTEDDVELDSMWVYFFEDEDNSPQFEVYAGPIVTKLSIMNYVYGYYFDMYYRAITISFETVELPEGRWWVCLQPEFDTNESYWLTAPVHENSIFLHFPDYGHTGWVKGSDFWPGEEYDVAYKLYGQALWGDLEAEADLSWTDIEKGSTVDGTIIVENVGPPESPLDWEIISCPDWGTWSFDPIQGLDLTPEDGPFTVDVEVTAPDEKDDEFSGTIVLRNMEHHPDMVEIPVSLKTPRSQRFSFTVFQQVIQLFIQRFPLMNRLFN